MYIMSNDININLVLTLFTLSIVFYQFCRKQ